VSEEDLLQRARRGDAAAFADLCVPHQRRAFNLALRLCGSRELAADLCQEALLRAYTSLGRFRGDSAFGTWLLRIVHNLCIDAMRRRDRRPQSSLEEEPVPPTGGDDPEEELLRQERRRLLLAALRRLSPEFRAAVVLRDVQGLSYDEAAAVAGVPVGTFKSRLHRARAELRELLRGTAVFG
jgi:RNA polymerase sigma-70 factor (ECF subfamily)